ncbi:MAG: hypothetical protein JWQ96_1148 [Segetibacter sp.]|nr:hypothetical protein [Segetibacter sp.]
MLTKSNIKKLAVLPLLFFVVLFFAFKNREDKSINNIYTVVIDAGHGGNDNGAISKNGLKEKDIALTLAKTIKELNSNNNVRIILSREIDETLSPKQRTTFLEKNKADLLISLHINTVAPNSKNKNTRGIEIHTSKGNSPFIEQSKILGNILSTNLEPMFNQRPLIMQRVNKLWLIDENGVCPSALVECGYISSSKDVALLNSQDLRKQLANAVLKTIDQYFSYKK